MSGVRTRVSRGCSAATLGELLVVTRRKFLLATDGMTVVERQLEETHTRHRRAAGNTTHRRMLTLRLIVLGGVRLLSDGV